MLSCDVLIVGGGPAGSTCAWGLRRAGLDVVVMDRATFPRDKLCAGWITPQVVAALELDVESYRRGRTFQVIDGFRVGVVGDDFMVSTEYGRPVSFGIRRCEFDHYLLQRSGARLVLGTPVQDLHRDGAGWVVNGTIRSTMLIGAGGHFCPVARMLNPAGDGDGSPLVVAREAEYPVELRGSRSGEKDDGSSPELFFCRDLKGYGWCLRKQSYLNVGLGRVDQHSLPAATADFLRFLTTRGWVAPKAEVRWRGHAYLLHNGRSHRQIVGDGVLLLGDAAGLAYPQSGEGIRPAVESGLLAAAAVIEAEGLYALSRLQPFADRLFAGAQQTPSGALSHLWSSAFGLAVARGLLHVPSFVRHVVMDRWFLQANRSFDQWRPDIAGRLVQMKPG